MMSSRGIGSVGRFRRCTINTVAYSLSLSYYLLSAFRAGRGSRSYDGLGLLTIPLGPIIRISPEELHVRDPDWYDELMTTSIRPRDKSEAFAGRSGRDSIFGTVQHDHHRVRRGALNPFFSKKSISAIQPLIQSKVDLLCTGLGEYAPDGSDEKRAGREIELGVAYMSLTLDVISHYAFGKSYGLLDPGFRSC